MIELIAVGNTVFFHCFIMLVSFCAVGGVLCVLFVCLFVCVFCLVGFVVVALVWFGF